MRDGVVTEFGQYLVIESLRAHEPDWRATRALSGNSRDADVGRMVTQVIAANLDLLYPEGRLRSVHVFQPAATSAEVSVHVRYGQRSRALAARLERRDGHWTCTALLLG